MIHKDNRIYNVYIRYVPAKDNIANVFTKSLSKKQIIDITEKLYNAELSH